MIAVFPCAAAVFGLLSVPSSSLVLGFLGVIGLGLRITTDPVEIALDVTGRGLLTATGLSKSVRDPLLVGEVAVTARGHSIPLVALVRAIASLL